jgi:hypothetical protein
MQLQCKFIHVEIVSAPIPGFNRIIATATASSGTIQVMQKKSIACAAQPRCTFHTV